MSVTCTLHMTRKRYGSLASEYKTPRISTLHGNREVKTPLTKTVAAFRGMHMSPTKHIAMRDYQESVTTGQTDIRTDAGQK